MCAPRFKPGPPSEEAQVLSDRLKWTITACAMPFDNPLIPDRITLTVRAFFRSQRCAYTQSARRGFYMSMRLVSIMMATCLMPHSLRWSLHSKTVILYKLVCLACLLLTVDLVSSNTTATLPKATYDEETGRTTCTRKVRVPLPLNRLPISYSFGVFDGYDPSLVSSRSHPKAEMLLHQNDRACGPHRI